MAFVLVVKRKNMWTEKEISSSAVLSPTVLQECNDEPEDSFSKPAAYITHNSSSPLHNNTRGNL